MRWIKKATAATALSAAGLLFGASTVGAATTSYQPPSGFGWGNSMFEWASSIPLLAQTGDSGDATGEATSGDSGAASTNASSNATGGDSGDSNATGTVTGGDTGDATSTASNDLDASSGDVSSGDTGDATATGTATGGSSGRLRQLRQLRGRLQHRPVLRDLR